MQCTCKLPETNGKVHVELNLIDCLIYLDDMIIFSSTFEEHLERLDAVFSRLKQHNLKLKPSKCEFLRSEVTYLGHVVSEEGIRTDPEKTKAVKNWPVQKERSQSISRLYRILQMLHQALRQYSKATE